VCVCVFFILEDILVFEIFYRIKPHLSMRSPDMNYPSTFPPFTITEHQETLFCGAFALMSMAFIRDGHHPPSRIVAQVVIKLCLLGGPKNETFGNMIENIQLQFFSIHGLAY